MTVTRISVTGDAGYDVVVGTDLAPLIPGVLGGAAHVVLMADPAVISVVERVQKVLDDSGFLVTRIDIEAGEAAKSLPVVSQLWDRLGELRLTRSDAIVAVGGGAITDLGGFVAATWLRGIRVVHVPTTLLAMVDAAIGGKTGINTAAGKNLVGAFHPPVGVFVDFDVLSGLPAAQWANGMAEVVKAGFIADPAILDLVETDLAGAREGGTAAAEDLIIRSIAMKAAVVSDDLRESGRRESLNYGHTLGHSIELRERYAVPHGHAISIGMVFAAELSRLAGTIDRDLVERHVRVLDGLNLPVRYDRAAWPELLDGMRIDKKSRGSTLRFVVLDGLGGTRILTAPETSMLEAAYSKVAA